MFPIEDTAQNIISPSTILTILAKHDRSHFTSQVNEIKLKSHTFKLQADGGANRLVTNNRDMIYVSWYISPYTIGRSGDRVVRTAKGVFHLICDNSSVLTVIILYSEQVTETVALLTDIIFSNMDTYDSW